MNALNPPKDNITFGGLLTKHMKDRQPKITDEQMAHWIDKTPDTVANYRHDRTIPELSVVIAICVALELTYSESLVMIRKAGYALTGSPLHNMYDAIIMGVCANGMAVRNEVLIAYHFPALTHNTHVDDLGNVQNL